MGDASFKLGGRGLENLVLKTLFSTVYGAVIVNLSFNHYIWGAYLLQAPDTHRPWLELTFKTSSIVSEVYRFNIK